MSTLNEREVAWWDACVWDLADAIERDKPDAYALSAIVPDFRAELKRELHSAAIALLWKRDEQTLKERAPGVYSVMVGVMHLILKEGGYYG